MTIRTSTRRTNRRRSATLGASAVLAVAVAVPTVVALPPGAAAPAQALGMAATVAPAASSPRRTPRRSSPRRRSRTRRPAYGRCTAGGCRWRTPTTTCSARSCATWRPPVPAVSRSRRSSCLAPATRATRSSPQYGWGTPLWAHKMEVITDEAAKLGLVVDQNLGPQYPPTVPTLNSFNQPEAEQQLIYGREFNAAGPTRTGALPAPTTAPPSVTTQLCGAGRHRRRGAAGGEPRRFRRRRHRSRSVPARPRRRSS